MGVSLNFHSTQKVTLVKHELTGSIWYNVYLHMRHYGPEPEIIQEISIFCDAGVTSLSPFEEMWQAQEAERLAEEKRINDEEDAARLALGAAVGDAIAEDFGTDPDLAADLLEGTSPVAGLTLPDEPALLPPTIDPRFDALEEEHIDASR